MGDCSGIWQTSHFAGILRAATLPLGRWRAVRYGGAQLVALLAEVHPAVIETGAQYDSIASP
jgi:hypothetical protein